MTLIQNRIIGKELPIQSQIEDTTTLIIQGIIGIKDLDVDLEHDPGEHDSKHISNKHNSQFRLEPKAV